jgi:PAS domain S-box-containing protein
MPVLDIGAKKVDLAGRGSRERMAAPDDARAWPSLGLRAREVLVVTLLTFLVVVTTTLLNLSYLTRRTLDETDRQAQLLTRQIYGFSARALSRAPGQEPAQALAVDQELRDFLNLAVQYSPHALYIAITDPTGRAVVHTDQQNQGTQMPHHPPWTTLLSYNAIRRAWAVYGGDDQIYEVVLPLTLDRQPFGAIRVGIPLSLVRTELREPLAQSALFGGVALLGALVVALGLSGLTLRPIRRLARDMERLERGEFDVGTSPSPTDEFGQIAVHLQRLGRELHADRTQVQKQNARYQHIVDHLEDGLLFLDSDQRLQFANRAAGLILGASVGEAQGSALTDVLGAWHPVPRLIQHALGESTSLQSVSVRVPSEGGDTDCMVSVFPVGASGQALEGILVLMKDLRALTVSARTLRSLIRYSAQVAALGKATSEVTHEVKNPLNAMAIHLRLLKDRLGDAPDAVRQSVDVIQKQISRLDSVVQNFMNAIHPEALALEPVHVGALLQEICSLLEAEWRDKGVSFVVRTAPEASNVQGNADALRAAFMNLVLNACQAMPTGGVVSVTVEQSQEDLVATTISDTGGGIKPEDMDRIFRISFTTKPGGSGIGLAVVRRTIEMHDGDIEVSSRVGQGTTIVVRLPVG